MWDFSVKKLGLLRFILSRALADVRWQALGVGCCAFVVSAYFRGLSSPSVPPAPRHSWASSAWSHGLRSQEGPVPGGLPPGGPAPALRLLVTLPADCRSPSSLQCPLSSTEQYRHRAGRGWALARLLLPSSSSGVHAGTAPDAAPPPIVRESLLA